MPSPPTDPMFASSCRFEAAASLTLSCPLVRRRWRSVTAPSRRSGTSCAVPARCGESRATAKRSCLYRLLSASRFRWGRRFNSARAARTRSRRSAPRSPRGQGQVKRFSSRGGGSQPSSPDRCSSQGDPPSQTKTPLLRGFSEPSVGLEPTTPSLPWKVLGFTSVHGRSRAGTKSLQTAAIRTVRLRRPKNGRDETGGRKMDGRHGSAVDPKVVEVLVSGRRVFSLPVPRPRRSGRSTKRARRRVATDDLRVAVAHSVGDQARARRSCR